MKGGAPQARFDDLSPGGASFHLAAPVDVFEGRQPDEVGPCLEAAVAAAREGLWVAGYVAYEAAPGLDPALEARVRPRDDPFGALPLVWFATFARREADPLPEPLDPAPPLPPDAWRPSESRASYESAVERVRELIRRGETYQVNHTMRLRARLDVEPTALYRDLCFAQRGGQAAYLDLGRYQVLSASPELFFRIDGTGVTTRPMKGTRPRGRWLEEDEAAAAALLASAKDRAENAMIVDLLRNDLGRVARTGSVQVPSMFDAERYETVWQLTSTVRATLPEQVSLVEVFRALFPSGSVTGAPKIRTMRIIAELESSPRGVYCGAVGFLAPIGAEGPSARFNVAIRTLVHDAETGTAEYGTGGGITHDSVASAEYEEALAKARVLTVRRPAFELFESIRLDDDGFRHLGLHLERMRSSALYFGFSFDEDAAVEALEKAAAGQDGPAVVRLSLARDGTLTAASREAPDRSASPVRLAVDEDDPVQPDDVLLFHKTTLRARYDEALARHPEAEDVVLVNSRGEVTESTIANVAVLLDGRWWTPPLDCGLLPGTARAAMLADGTLAERRITVGEIRRAADVALVSSVRGFRSAVLS